MPHVSSLVLSQTRVYLHGYTESNEYFECRRKKYPATERNYWGGVESEPVTLYSNGVDGREAWMYAVIVVPEVDDAVSLMMLPCAAVILPKAPSASPTDTKKPHQETTSTRTTPLNRLMTTFRPYRPTHIFQWCRASVSIGGGVRFSSLHGTLPL